MKKIIYSVLLIIMTMFIFACNKQTNTSEAKGEKEEMKPKVEISVVDFGKMTFELDKENAPITVDNFLKLVNEGFYNGLTFHRIIPEFMIQGGDPMADGTGGAPNKIKGEFINNGVDNKIEHRRGVISMARSNDYNSASSQFFIVHQDSTFLDGDYAAFGNILTGIEVVDKICEEVRVLDNNGTVNKREQPVIEYIKVIE